ncbi:MAG: helix-turn-helix domain-containing protein, partial [Nitrospinota bacterium]
IETLGDETLLEMLQLVNQSMAALRQVYGAQAFNIGANIGEAAGAVGRPAPLMAREQKVRVVRDLERKGIFLIKGAVDEVARLLGVSRYTVYNYRKEGSLA